MTTMTQAAHRLRDICNRYGDHPAARGATNDDIGVIKSNFAKLRFPLPDGLLEVYRVTLAIPGVLNDMPVLMAPCSFASLETTPYVLSLINRMDESDEEGAIWLGHGNEGSLIIDRDGQCGLRARKRDDGVVDIINPRSFEEAFIAYVARHEAEMLDEFSEQQNEEQA